MLGGGSQRSLMAVVATLDEEDGVGPTLTELRQYLGDINILVVDGKSRDRTVEKAKDHGAQVIFQPRKGKGDALGEAFRYVSRNADLSETDLKYVVLTDADYTYPAEYLPEMLNILETNPEIGMVCGNRFDSKLHVKRAMKNMFYLGNRMLAFSHNLFNGVDLRDPLTGLRIIRWSILQNWVPKSKGFDIEVELNHLVENRGFGIKEVEINYRQRLGEKKLKMRHGFTIFRRILSESFHDVQKKILL